ncbi:MAG: sensor histidine kinase [Bacteroidetes bacterium]|nr:MAG: sensor histidine kinase [Bacteroidota bacterium]
MQNQIIYITVIFAILITVIIIYFFASIIRYHRRYMKLQRERILIEITIQENERKRIANDLHDSLGPLLSAVKLNINSIEVQPQDEPILERAGKSLDEIIASMRQISYELLPNTLERKGLTEAVREFIGHVSNKKNIKIDLYVVKDVHVPKEKEIHIFRMIQEIIHNTIKHAHAKNLDIGLSEEDKSILLLAKDDGVGFDVEKEKERSGGFGLKSLESRCEILQGVLTLESKIGFGTNYFVKIPID